MGGKSRKAGGVSRKLIQQLKLNQNQVQGNNKSNDKKKVKKFITDEKTGHKGLFGKSKKNRC
jgi:hypothetical protein